MQSAHPDALVVSVEQTPFMRVIESLSQGSIKDQEFFRTELVRVLAKLEVSGEEKNKLIADIAKAQEEKAQLIAEHKDFVAKYKDGVAWVDALEFHPKTKLYLNAHIIPLKEKRPDGYRFTFTSKDPSERIQRKRKSNVDESHEQLFIGPRLPTKRSFVHFRGNRRRLHEGDLSDE